jgi:hypothetical protein
MRFKRIDPAGYAATDRISLVSSMVTTLLCADGEIKGIDESDACGMNLWAMDRAERGWHEDVLAVVAGEDGVQELKRKLGKVETDGGKMVGRIGDWFVRRYGFDRQCAVFPGTGDNPATFLAFTRESAAWLPSRYGRPLSQPQYASRKPSSPSAHPIPCSSRRQCTTLIRNTMRFSILPKLPVRARKMATRRGRRRGCATLTCSCTRVSGRLRGDQRGKQVQL